MPNLSRDLFLLFGLAFVPLLLLAVSALFDRLHRARVERLMKRSAAALDPVAIHEPPHARAPLVLQYLDVSNVGPVHGVASRALIGAADATRRFRNALSAAALVYMAVLAGAVCPRLCRCRPRATGSRSRSIACTVHRYVCFSGTSWIPCACVCSSLSHTSGWALRSCCSHRPGNRRVPPPRVCGHVLRHADGGPDLPPGAASASGPGRAVRARPFRRDQHGDRRFCLPAAWRRPGQIPSVSWWIWAVGTASQLVAIVVTGWLLRRPSVRWPITGLVGMALTGIVVGRMAPASRVDLC